jgi:hypothetical protein
MPNGLLSALAIGEADMVAAKVAPIARASDFLIVLVLLDINLFS